MAKAAIEIIYHDGTETAVKNDMLDVLIATNKIMSFKRSSGWVHIDGTTASLRDYRSRELFAGEDRRAPWPGHK